MKHGHGHDIDTNMSTPIIIWKNDIIQCNHKYWCSDTDTSNPRSVHAS
jgi:hypothetical protein